MADEMKTGEWYEVEFLVPASKKLTGKLLRTLKTEDGAVFMFEGRFPFAVEEDKMVNVAPTAPPKTGVRKA